MKYIIANWKQNKNEKEIMEFLENFEKSENEVIIAAPFLYLHLLKKSADEKGFKVAAQNVSENDNGAHTGEIGAQQLRDYCDYCIIGHSERKETLKEVIAKRDTLLKHNLKPIICFVKPEEAQQLYKENCLLAWEDPENISINGQYKTKEIEEIALGMEQIKYLLPENAILLYGGSVNKDNSKKIAEIENLGGVLVGNASLDISHFCSIIKSF